MRRARLTTAKTILPTMSTALLKVQTAQFNVLVYNDAGSGAKQDLSTWKPALDEGWYYLGPTANNGNAQGRPGIIIQPAGKERVTAPIVDWEQVWNDGGSGKSSDYALWRGLVAPEDRDNFVVLGGFFTRSHAKPTVDDSMNMRAVRKDIVIQVAAGSEIWTDRGTGAREDGAIWGISTDGFFQAVGTGAFVPVLGYDKAPTEVYALNKDKLTAA
ncbi:hypothetical protein NP233_g7399 [Leucocoprinus birnbaumii]|uniref:Uncharacterized protein n=1 Tax=Leucocoprinus birnbaumii TaxID=56174 RepID=A0AAD5VRB0_9AGAR|nr:hypothetical protein NP233_g7399 [Leucocoprinus birnbaumii]